MHPSLAALLLKHWECDAEATQCCVRERRRRESEPCCPANRKVWILVRVPCEDRGENLLWTQGGLLVVLVGPGS